MDPDHGSNQKRAEFVEPASLADGEKQRCQLAEEIGNISNQLNSRRQEQHAKFVERHPNGTRGSWELSAEERLEGVEHQKWKRSALHALRARESVLRRLNDWIKNERRRLYVAGGGPAEENVSVKLIKQAYELLSTLREEAVEFDPEELDFIERLRAYVEERAPQQIKRASAG